MWSSWALIGLLQICTNRYWRTNWRWNKVVHALLGLLAMVLVLTAGLITIKLDGWSIRSASNLHAKVGFSVFVLGLLLMLGGLTASIFRLNVPMAWNTRTVLTIGKLHRYFGWMLVISS